MKKNTLESFIGNGLPYSPFIHLFDELIGKDLLDIFSGMIPNIESKKLVSPDNLSEQLDQVGKKMTTLLEQAGRTLDDVVFVAVLVTDMKNYEVVNDFYEKLFGNVKKKPARIFFAVVGLPFGSLVEILPITIRQEKQEELVPDSQIA